MNRNNMLLIGVAVFFVIGVGLTAFMLMGRGGQTTPPPGAAQPAPPPVKTFVATKDIPPRTIITANMLSESTDTQPVAGAITDMDAAIGKLTTEPIMAGETIRTSMTTEPLGRVVPASFAIPQEGQQSLRGVGIWVDPLQTAAGLVDKGDRVDIIAVHKLKVTGNDSVGEVASGRTIAQDLEVLAVDRSLEEAAKPTPVPAAPAAPGAPPAAPAPPPAPTPPPQPGQQTFTRIIVAAPPEIAERLVAANSTGALHITIRDPQTRENYPVPSVREYPAISVDPTSKKIRDAVVDNKIADMKWAAEQRRKRSEARSGGSGSGKPIPDPKWQSMLPMPVPTPVPTPDIREITVVRGTEKTRVVVPR